MKYYAKLVMGGVYKIITKSFDYGVELPVTKEEYDYLSTVNEKRLVGQGDGYKVVEHPRFKLRTEELSKEETALADIEDAPEKLAVKKPGK